MRLGVQRIIANPRGWIRARVRSIPGCSLTAANSRRSPTERPSGVPGRRPLLDPGGQARFHSGKPDSLSRWPSADSSLTSTSAWSRQCFPCWLWPGFLMLAHVRCTWSPRGTGCRASRAVDLRRGERCPHGPDGRRRRGARGDNIRPMNSACADPARRSPGRSATPSRVAPSRAHTAGNFTSCPHVPDSDAWRSCTSCFFGLRATARS